MQANSNTDTHPVHVFNEATSAFALDSAVNAVHINHMTLSLRLR